MAAHAFAALLPGRAAAAHVEGLLPLLAAANGNAAHGMVLRVAALVAAADYTYNREDRVRLTGPVIALAAATCTRAGTSGLAFGLVRTICTRAREVRP